MCISNTDNNIVAVDSPVTPTTVSAGARRRNRSAYATWFKPLMVSTQEACEMLGLKDAGSVLKQVHRGRLEGKKMGNKYLITVRSIERFAFGDFDK